MRLSSHHIRLHLEIQDLSSSDPTLYILKKDNHAQVSLIVCHVRNWKLSQSLLSRLKVYGHDVLYLQFLLRKILCRHKQNLSKSLEEVFVLKCWKQCDVSAQTQAKKPLSLHSRGRHNRALSECAVYRVWGNCNNWLLARALYTVQSEEAISSC